MRFVIYGQPQPAGSKRAFVRGTHASVVDANPKAGDWKLQVAQVVGQEYDGEPLDGPLSVTLDFFQPRPKSHYGTGANAAKLKPSAPRYPTGRPDALKLARAVEDALTGVLWTDDSRIVVEHLGKFYGQARCEVIVFEMAA